MQQFIVRPIARSLSFDGCRFRQDLLFERQIGIEVDLGGLDRLMPQPKCDQRPIHSSLKQLHRGRVSKNMRRDPL